MIFVFKKRPRQFEDNRIKALFSNENIKSAKHTWPRVEIKGGDEFSKNFQTPGGGPRVGMIFNPRGGRG